MDLYKWDFFNILIHNRTDMIEQNTSATYERTNKIERLVIDRIFKPFCFQMNYYREEVVDPEEQYKDIDSYIDGQKIQEKSGITYSPWVLMEVYNDINPNNQNAKLEGWGLFTEADYHFFIYRGTPGVAIDWDKVHIAKYESAKIREMCHSAIETDDFINEVNELKSKIANGEFNEAAYGGKKIKLKNGKVAWMNCNSSKLVDGDGVKYAVTIKVNKRDLGENQELYKFNGTEFVKQE